MSYIKRTVRPQKMARDLGSGKIQREGANQLASDMRLCFMHMQKKKKLFFDAAHMCFKRGKPSIIQSYLKIYLKVNIEQSNLFGFKYLMFKFQGGIKQTQQTSLNNAFFTLTAARCIN